jgi:two-component system sensor histidine kinase/response regulator
MQFESARFALRECLEEVSTGMSVWAQQKGLELTCNVESKAPEGLIGDPRPLRQMLINLVGNVIKLIEHGEVVISARCIKKGSNHVWLHFTVKDAGIGILPEGKLTASEALAQTGDSASVKNDGAASEFAIYETLVSLMGGRIWVEAGVRGRGNAFHFTARFQVDAEAVAKVIPLHKEQVRGLEILLAEDNRVSQMVAVRLLEKYGHRVSVVQDGKEALDVATRLKFDLVLMDLQMPEMDGVASAAAIRDAERQIGARLPIIAVTAHTSEEDRKRCKDAGMDAFVCKPINCWDLFNSIEAVGLRAR